MDYLVVNGNHTVTATELGGDTGIKAKRTIITLGGDITIADDIDLRDSPIALIALIDAAGNG